MLSGQILVRASLQISGVVFNDLDNLKVLHGRTNSTTGLFQTPRDGFGTAGYVVPAGKTLRILAVQLGLSGTSVSPNQWALGYGDTDVGVAATAAPTNPKYLANDSIASGAYIMEVIGNIYECGGKWEIPTGKYPFFSLGVGVANAFQRCFGYEV